MRKSSAERQTDIWFSYGCWLCAEYVFRITFLAQTCKCFLFASVFLLFLCNFLFHSSSVSFLCSLERSWFGIEKKKEKSFTEKKNSFYSCEFPELPTMRRCSSSLSNKTRCEIDNYLLWIFCCCFSCI